MSAAHTPGPWTRRDGLAYIGHYIGPANDGGAPSVALAISGVSRSEAEIVANARLIAAAPKLAEIVRISIGNVRSLGPAGALASVSAPYEVWLRELESAYFAATGEQA